MRLALVGALTAALVSGALPVWDRASTLSSLVEAERAFARLSVKIGHVPAFLAYFADDVVTFPKAPTTGKESLRAQAESMPVPPPRVLDWEPWFADVAASGDLGCTTGPTVLTDAASGMTLRTGWYLSVWRHDANGWRVAADIGIEAPAAGRLRPKAVETGSPVRTRGRPGRAKDALRSLERRLSDRSVRGGLSDAYRPLVGPQSRLHRDGLSPVVGPDAIGAYLAQAPQHAVWRVVDAVVSSAGDFAYTYGTYEAAPGRAPADATSSFLHVWKARPGGWTLAADVVTR